MTCIIVEDQPPAQRILKKYINDIGSLSLKGVFSDAIQAMDFLKIERVDLIFLDIHLPKISGIDFLRVIFPQPQVILTTAFPEYALESYEFAVVDYLLKPFSFHRFVKAVAKVRIPPIEQISLNENKHLKSREIFVKSGYEHVRIDLDEIIYIKSDADYTEIVTTVRKYLSSEPLRDWLDQLDHDQYVRIHKSYIINIRKTERVVGNQIYLQGNFSVPIGRTYKDDFVSRFISKNHQ